VTGPQRRVTDHIHPEYWTEADQHRFEDRITRELHAIRAEVKDAGIRLTYLFGGLAVIAFLLPIVAPFIRSMFSINP
jgi:hypothetical protein